MSGWEEAELEELEMAEKLEERQELEEKICQLKKLAVEINTAIIEGKPGASEIIEEYPSGQLPCLDGLTSALSLWAQRVKKYGKMSRGKIK